VSFSSHSKKTVALSRVYLWQKLAKRTSEAEQLIGEDAEDEVEEGQVQR